MKSMKIKRVYLLLFISCYVFAGLPLDFRLKQSKVRHNKSKSQANTITARVNDDFDSSLFDDDANITSKLPWQIRWLGKLLSSFSRNEPTPVITPIIPTPVPSSNLFHKVLQRTRLSFSKLKALFHVWLATHKKTFLFMLKGFGFTLITVFIINRIISWYQNIAGTNYYKSIYTTHVYTSALLRCLTFACICLLYRV